MNTRLSASASTPRAWMGSCRTTAPPPPAHAQRGRQQLASVGLRRSTRAAAGGTPASAAVAHRRHRSNCKAARVSPRTHCTACWPEGGGWRRPERGQRCGYSLAVPHRRRHFLQHQAASRNLLPLQHYPSGGGSGYCFRKAAVSGLLAAPPGAPAPAAVPLAAGPLLLSPGSAAVASASSSSSRIRRALSRPLGAAIEAGGPVGPCGSGSCRGSDVLRERRRGIVLSGNRKCRLKQATRLENQVRRQINERAAHRPGGVHLEALRPPHRRTELDCRRSLLGHALGAHQAEMSHGHPISLHPSSRKECARTVPLNARTRCPRGSVCRCLQQADRQQTVYSCWEGVLATPSDIELLV